LPIDPEERKRLEANSMKEVEILGKILKMDEAKFEKDEEKLEDIEEDEDQRELFKHITGAAGSYYDSI
jgi:hypothetical protein